MIDKVIKQYQGAFDKYGNSEKSVFWPKGRQKERFDALTRSIVKRKFSILDFGCGLGHMFDYLNEIYDGNFSYHGVDIVDSFIAQNKLTFPNTDFQLIQDYSEIQKSFDYVLISGVFNISYFEDLEKHKNLVYQMLEGLFSKTSVYLSVNFMSDQVDFIQEGAYHQNINELLRFVSEKLSKRYVLDCSYMPYEFTITVFNDQTIERPDNIYKNE
jgi:trans-aconitate methyltransferase